MKTFSLNGLWRCIGTEEHNTPIKFNMTVPGTVHTGMMENKLLPDIFYGKNADGCMWIEKKDWTFEKEFDFSLSDDVKKAEIEFLGLDTYCEIFLNGNLLLSCDNMHITYLVDVLPYLKDGKNILRLKFFSPTSRVLNVNYGICGGAFSNDRIFTRRMQCTYGWDWVHRLVTMGIWRDVTLYINRFVKIDSLQARLKNLSDFGADMEIALFGTHSHEFFYGAFGRSFPHDEVSPMVRFTVTDPDGEIIYTNKRLFRESLTLEYFTVETPKLWHPNGYGESPLYKLNASVTDENDNLICEKTVNFGIRTVTITEKTDKKGSDTYKLAEQKFAEFIQTAPQQNEYSSFELYINNARIFCRGGNWVPADPFPGNVTYEKLESLIKLAHDAGINMLRVWGGGYFECDDFYNLCDKYGIMLQQDFLMACGTYPYDDDYLEEHDPDYLHFTESFSKECDQNIARIVSHPSLVWYNGDNENQMSFNENFINNSRRLANGITLPLIRKYDTERRFFSSSPWGGSHFNSPAKGMFHATGFLDFYLRYIKNDSMDNYVEYFGNAVSRFANETPVMSSISLCSLKKFIPEEELAMDKFSHFDYHTKNHPADEYKDFHLFDHINLGAKKIFGDFKSDTDRLLKMNLLGYEWIRACMESYRRNQKFSSGNLFWMYNDCWPAIGWSMVDYYGVPKTAYYAMKKASQDICTSVVNEDGKIKVYISNVGVSDTSVSGKLYLVNSDEVKKTVAFEFMSKANSAEVAFECDDIEFKTDENTILVCDANSDRTFYSNLKPAALKLSPANITLYKNDTEITLKSDKLAMFVTLDGEFSFSENCMILLPGETKTVSFKKTLNAKSDDVEVYSIN